MMSETFVKTVRYLSDDVGVSNSDLRLALAKLDEEFLAALGDPRPIVLERYRLRKILKAVALERGLLDLSMDIA